MSDNGGEHEGRGQPTYVRDGGRRKSDGETPSLREIFECLTSLQRRLTLYYLQDHESAEVDELATHIAAQEAGCPPEEVPSDRCNQIKTHLVHTHLPKLADAHCIEYDHRSKTIRYRQPPTRLEKVLRLLSELEEQEK